MFLRGFFLLLAAFVPLALQAQVRPPDDECEVGAPRVCVRHVLQDEGHILTSPLHVRPSDLLWIVPFGVATGVAIDYDAHALRSLGRGPQRGNEFCRASGLS